MTSLPGGARFPEGEVEGRRSGRALGSVWRRARIAIAALAPLVLVVSGCSDGFFGEGETEPPLPGERIPVMLLDQQLTPDPEIAALEVVLPRPLENADWPQPGGNAAHVLYHVELPNALSQAWRADIGSGSDDDETLLASPVVADGRVFTLDAGGELSAFEAGNGSRIWSVDTRPDEERDAIFSGGITFEAGRVIVASGAGEVVSVDASNGAILWRKRVPGPVRGAPTVADGRIFVVTLDNQAVALSFADGTRIWTHTGIAEVSALLGGPSPAVSGGAVAVPYSSGELFLLKVENGRVLWVDSLSRIRPADAVSSLADIRGSPVIDRDLVVAVSHSGRLIATDLRSGARLWEQNIAGVHTPWAAGDFIYVLTTQGEVFCLTRRDGRIKWIVGLPVFEDPEDKEGPISYAGPVLAGDRLLVPGSDGSVYAISPYTGEVLGVIDLGDPIYIPPVVAGGTVYFLADDGTLYAYR